MYIESIFQINMTTIPTKIGIALIAIYWICMAGMCVNAYRYFHLSENIHYDR
jgi:hypothetical protein